MSAHSPPPLLIPSRWPDLLTAALETAIADIAHETAAALVAYSAGEPGTRAGLTRALIDSELLARIKVATVESQDAKLRLQWVRAVARMILAIPPKPECKRTEPSVDDEQGPFARCPDEPVIRRRHPTEPDSPRAMAAAGSCKRLAATSLPSEPPLDPDPALDAGARR